MTGGEQLQNLIFAASLNSQMHVSYIKYYSVLITRLAGTYKGAQGSLVLSTIVWSQTSCKKKPGERVWANGLPFNVAEVGINAAMGDNCIVAWCVHVVDE